MKKLNIVLMAALTWIAIGFALVQCTAAHAALCKTTTSNGQAAFMFKPDAKGSIKPMVYLGGKVATLPQCLVTQVIIERIVYEDYQAPNPVNDCERQAVLACDPSFKGLPIGNVGNMRGYCGFVFLTTKVNSEDTTIRYVNGAVYDGHSFAGYDKDNICRSPLNPNDVQ